MKKNSTIYYAVDYADTGRRKENLAILKNRYKNRANVRIGFRILNPELQRLHSAHRPGCCRAVDCVPSSVRFYNVSTHRFNG